MRLKLTLKDSIIVLKDKELNSLSGEIALQKSIIKNKDSEIQDLNKSWEEEKKKHKLTKSVLAITGGFTLGLFSFLLLK